MNYDSKMIESVLHPCVVGETMMLGKGRAQGNA